MTRRPLLLTLAVALALLIATVASAATGSGVSIRVAPRDIALGARVKVSGHVTFQGAPTPSPLVALEVQRFPYRRPFRTVARGQGSAGGAYEFRVRLDRNSIVRVTSAGYRSAAQHVYVRPRTSLSQHESRDGRHLRVTLSARSPRDVRLGGRVVVYLGPYGRHRVKAVSRPTMRHRSAGLSRATVLLGLPKAWRGGYTLQTCYAAPSSSGMRRPGASCPRVVGA